MYFRVSPKQSRMSQVNDQPVNVNEQQVSVAPLNAINQIISSRKLGEEIPHTSEILPGVFIGNAAAIVEKKRQVTVLRLGSTRLLINMRDWEVL